MGEAQQRASAAEGPGRWAPSLSVFVHSGWAGCLAEVGRGVAGVTPPFWNWACVSSVTAGPRASTRDGRGWAEPRVRVLCRSTGRGGELGLGSGSCQSGPPPFPQGQDRGPSRCSTPGAAALVDESSWAQKGFLQTG